jgi:cobalt-zinc-cadmium efflux system outer membrane protein
MFRTFLPLALLIAATSFAQTGPSPAGLPNSPGSQAITVSADHPSGQQQAPTASTQSAQPTLPGSGARISLDQAIELALSHNPNLKAMRTEIGQNKAQETTANLRPNPTLSFDSQFLPIFNPSQFTTNTIDTVAQFDLGVGYLFERGGKRQRRLQAARDTTAVTEQQVSDAERALTFNVAEQFVNALLAKSNLDFGLQDLASFQQTVDISNQRYRAGDISEGDLLKIKLQLLTFQNDVAQARVTKAQALINLRQLLGYDSVPRDFDVAGELEYVPLPSRVEGLEAKALESRADLRAARLSVNAARSQVGLAKANGKQDFNLAVNFSHVSGSSSSSWFFSMPLPVFDRNQGEVRRTMIAVDQSKFAQTSAEEGVLADVRNAWESATSNASIVDLYTSGYLKQAEDSRNITNYAYKGGAATLLDLLDAERSYRSVQLGYRQALAAYMTSLEQLKQSVGTRTLP